MSLIQTYLDWEEALICWDRKYNEEHKKKFLNNQGIYLVCTLHQTITNNTYAQIPLLNKGKGFLLIVKLVYRDWNTDKSRLCLL